MSELPCKHETLIITVVIFAIQVFEAVKAEFALFDF